MQQRVDEYFAQSGQRRRDVPRMYVKTAVMLAWLAGSYYALVFVAANAVGGGACAISLGFAMAGVGFNVQHDGGHGAYSNRPWVNKVMALALDLLGGTAYFWHYKHNIAHHTHPNVHGHDDDINVGVLGRMSPQQRWYPAHRFQQFYMWAHLRPAGHRMADHRGISQPDQQALHRQHAGAGPGRARAGDLLGRQDRVLRSGVRVAAVRAIRCCTCWRATCWPRARLGLVLALVFQLAHCSDQAQFKGVSAEQPTVARAWAEHQVETTVDFARDNRVLDWYLGGLNFQVVHHLFPKICHVHYRALAPIVEEVCRAHDVRYFAYPTASGCPALARALVAA